MNLALINLLRKAYLKIRAVKIIITLSEKYIRRMNDEII